MGLYGIYESVSIIVLSFFGNLKAITGLALTMLLTAITWITFFVLQGIGLYKMAKKRGMKKKLLAFVPFVNIYYMGKLAGECVVFGQRMKRAGLYAMITEAISSVLCVGILAAQVVLYVKCGEPLINPIGGTPYWDVTGVGFLTVVANFHKIGMNVLGFAQLLAGIFMLILLSGLYKKYAPRQYFLLGFLTVMCPSRYIIIFVLRNKKAIDYDAYIRARREAYMRQQQQYHSQHGYGAPYGNPYHSQYGNGYSTPNPPPKPEEPFEEFASSSANEDTSAGSDDFFN